MVEVAPRVDGVKQERLHTRSSEYSRWHRTLGPEYMAFDVDFVEYRNGRGVVALMELTGECESSDHIARSTKYIMERTRLVRGVMSEMSIKLGVPAFLVIHTKDLSCFHVHDLNSEVCRVMSLLEYASFVRSL